MAISLESSGGVRAWTRNHPVVVFFVLAYVWSWLWWMPALRVVARGGDVPPSQWLPFLFVGGPGPTVAAVAVALVTGGWPGLRKLLTRSLTLRVNVAWYLLAFVLPILALAGGLILYSLARNDVALIQWAAWPVLFLGTLRAIPYGPLAEELGWRGFALPQLRQRRGVIVSSITIGVLWFGWHVPLFWLPGGAAISGQTLTVPLVAWYLAYLVCWSIVFTVVVERSGSVVPAIILHASLNAVALFSLFPNLSSDARTNSVLLSLVFVAIGVGILAAQMLRERLLVRGNDADTKLTD